MLVKTDNPNRLENTILRNKSVLRTLDKEIAQGEVKKDKAVSILRQAWEVYERSSVLVDFLQDMLIASTGGKLAHKSEFVNNIGAPVKLKLGLSRLAILGATKAPQEPEERLDWMKAACAMYGNNRNPKFQVVAHHPGMVKLMHKYLENRPKIKTATLFVDNTYSYCPGRWMVRRTWKTVPPELITKDLLETYLDKAADRAVLLSERMEEQVCYAKPVDAVILTCYTEALIAKTKAEQIIDMIYQQLLSSLSKYAEFRGLGNEGDMKDKAVMIAEGVTMYSGVSPISRTSLRDAKYDQISKYGREGLISLELGQIQFRKMHVAYGGSTSKVPTEEWKQGVNTVGRWLTPKFVKAINYAKEAKRQAKTKDIVL